jgi:hypothetical protein
LKVLVSRAKFGVWSFLFQELLVSKMFGFWKHLVVEIVGFGSYRF